MILVNGCSHTHGTWYCKEYGVDPWPKVLERLRGYDRKVLNIAEAGNSVSTVVKSTIDWIENNQKPDVVLCAFPQMSRYEVPQRGTNIHGANIFLDQEEDDIIEETVRQRICCNLGFLRVHNIHMIYYLILYCESNNINFKSFYMSDRPWKELSLWNPKLDLAYKHADVIYPNILKKIKSYDMFSDISMSFHRYKFTQGHFGHGVGNDCEGFDTHPDKKGHEFIADLVYRKLNGEDIEWLPANKDQILEEINSKPHVKNSDIWKVISSILDDAEPIEYEGTFVYD